MYQTYHCQTGHSQKYRQNLGQASNEQHCLHLVYVVLNLKLIFWRQRQTDRQIDSVSASAVAMVLFHQETRPQKIVSFLDAKWNQTKVIKSDPYGCNSNRRNVQTLSPLSDTFGTQYSNFLKRMTARSIK